MGSDLRGGLLRRSWPRLPSDGPFGGGGGAGNGVTPKKPTPAPPNKPGAKGCVGARVAKGVQGLLNVSLGELKTAGAIGVGLLGAADAPETAGTSLLATLGAGYLAISSQGQVISGQAQLYSAISGNFRTGEEIQQVGDIMSGPLTGVTTLIVTGNPKIAAGVANVESAVTLGAGAINSKTLADKIANGVDAALQLAGLPDSNCEVQ